MFSYLLLLHELRIGAVVDHVLPKYRSGEWTVYFLRIEIFVLSIQDEFVSFDSQADCGLLP